MKATLHQHLPFVAAEVTRRTHLHRKAYHLLRSTATVQWLGLAAVCLVFNALPTPAAEAQSPDFPLPTIERFENFGREDGIPANKVHAVLKTSDRRLWIGTWDGLCVRESNGKFERYGPEHGLSHKMVLCMVEDPKTGDLWIATMRGLSKLSGGKFTKYTQTDSGLPNNVVYGVDIMDDHVWVATAAGAGSLDLKTGLWKIYDHNNTVMHEPWCYAIKAAKGVVFIGVWGSGIIEHDPKSGYFKEFRDPDRDFHFDLVPDDGPINDITSWITWNEGLLWQCTYFGFARYDGKFWKTWVQDKTPLPSNFTQFAWPVGRTCWIGHDQGASLTDGNHWVNYLVGEKGGGIIEIHRPGQPVEKRTMQTALANGFVLGIWADETEAWFATSKGLSRGVFTRKSGVTKVADSREVVKERMP
jgi:ligand-binding sensor domain-containing protein